MKKITLLICFAFFTYVSFSQCINSTENSSVASTNDGFVQTLATNVDLTNPTEYVTVTGLIVGHNYRFISTHGSPEINDFITVTNISDTPVTNGTGTSPLTINNLQNTTVRVHVRTDNLCNTDAFFHNLRLIDLTVEPTTCHKPTFTTTTLLTYRSDTRMDITWIAPEYSTPEGYEVEFVPQGGGLSFSGSTVAPITSISTGEGALIPDTIYDISIRSTCGVNGNSAYTTVSIKTNANPPPANDLCSGAITLIEQTSISSSSMATPTAGTLLGGAGTDVVAEQCNGTTGNARDDVWYKFVAKTTNVHVTIEPSPNFDAVVTLYSGNCNSLTYLACSDNAVSNPSSEDISYSGLSVGNTYFVRTYYYGGSTPATPTFTIKIWSATVAIDVDNDGYVASIDCDDNDPNEFPGQIWYVDADGDGYGNGTSTTACERPTDYYTAGELTQTDGDCDDSDPDEYPGQIWYLGIDNDGDGFFGSQVTNDCEDLGGYSLTPPVIDDCDDSDSDEFPGQTWYLDADADGYGTGTSTVDCLRPTNYYTTAELTQTNGDCNDNVGTIYPGALEVWYDGVDQNCDGGSDYDQDSDGYDSDSYGGTDCDDIDPNVNPGMTEIEGNGLDDDCNPATPDTPLGIDDFSLNSTKIVPNPFNDKITIYLPSDYGNDKFDTYIYDINGRTILELPSEGRNGTIVIKNLNTLQQGLYFFKISSKSDGKSIVRELIKY